MLKRVKLNQLSTKSYLPCILPENFGIGESRRYLLHLYSFVILTVSCQPFLNDKLSDCVRILMYVTNCQKFNLAIFLKDNFELQTFF